MGKVLVTGAAGFIGHKIGLYFQNRGYEVLGWDRIESNNEFKIININMNDVEEEKNFLLAYRPDIIIHCAGNADVGKSVQDPELDYFGNVTLTHNLLFSLHRSGLENVKFVFLSSAGVYGNPYKLPITEDMELKPLSPYAVHKVMCEELCKYFENNYNMNIKVARIFSAYGDGLRKQIFWDMYNKSQKGSLPMFGTGNESRDYIHVDDVIQALYLIATEETEEIIFNVANGEEITIRKATEIFASHAGMDKEVISFNGIVREGDPLNWRADITKLKKLGYKKEVDIEDGIQRYVEWCGKIK